MKISKEKKPRTLPGLTTNAMSARQDVVEYLTTKIHQSAAIRILSISIASAKYYGPEDWLHIGIGQMMAFRFKKFLCWHPKNEGKAGLIEQQKKRLMGVRAGVSDYVIEHPECHATLYMEVKVKPNGPTPEQLEFLEYQRKRGHFAEVVYSMEQAHKILKDYENYCINYVEQKKAA